MIVSKSDNSKVNFQDTLQTIFPLSAENFQNYLNDIPFAISVNFKKVAQLAGQNTDKMDPRVKAVLFHKAIQHMEKRTVIWGVNELDQLENFIENEAGACIEASKKTDPKEKFLWTLRAAEVQSRHRISDQVELKSQRRCDRAHKAAKNWKVCAEYIYTLSDQEFTQDFAQCLRPGRFGKLFLCSKDAASLFFLRSADSYLKAKRLCGDKTSEEYNAMAKQALDKAIEVKKEINNSQLTQLQKIELEKEIADLEKKKLPDFKMTDPTELIKNLFLALAEKYPECEEKKLTNIGSYKQAVHLLKAYYFANSEAQKKDLIERTCCIIKNMAKNKSKISGSTFRDQFISEYNNVHKLLSESSIMSQSLHDLDGNPIDTSTFQEDILQGGTSTENTYKPKWRFVSKTKRT